MFEHAQVAPPNPNIVTEDTEARTIPAGLTLPPPALLWEWLSYIYQTTGEWWRPPTVNSTLKTAPRTESAPIVSVKEFQNFARAIQPANFPTKTAKTSSPKSLSGKTGFNYSLSAYYDEAEAIIARNGLIHNSEARLVLACIIAWSRFSLFAELPLDGMNWMALSFSKAACELKMRASTFKTSLETLETAGLIKLATLSEGLVSASTMAELQQRRSNLSGEAASLFNSHFFQKNTTLYLLTQAVNAALPDFNPFSERPVNMGKTSEVVLAAETTSESLSRSFLTETCNYESKYENEDISFPDRIKGQNTGKQGAVNSDYSAPGKLEKLVQSLSSHELSTYSFISLEASFKGYSRLGDGRETLDDWEALKFATNGRFTLEAVQTRYQQVKEVWESTGGCHNPLALLHWTLTNDVDPRRGKLKLGQPASSHNPVFSQPQVRRSNYEAPKARPQLSYQKRMFSHTELAKPDHYEEVLPAPESLKIFEPSAEMREPEKLWKIVFEDLTGRFQMPSTKLTLLQDAALRFKTEDSSQVEIVLRSIWEERQLDTSTRHLINLALRQRLGPGFEVTFSSK